VGNKTGNEAGDEKEAGVLALNDESRERYVDEILEQTVRDMKSVGTYKDEFLPAIRRYADMRLQFDVLMAQWYLEGCKITEVYVNKAKAANNCKTELYRSIESLRDELTRLEGILGLTPAGLKKIHDKGLTPRKTSKLSEALTGGP